MLQDKAVFGIPEGKFAPENRKHQGIPGIEILPGGRIFICYYCNSEPWEGPDSYLVVAVSDDGGRSWREIGVFAPPRSGLRIYDAVLWRSPDGILRICWAQCSSAKAWDVFDGRAGVWTSECTDAEADHPVWSGPRRIADGIMLNKPTVLRNGNWALPVALWSVYPEKMLPELAGLYRSNLLMTDDGGKTFRLVPGPEVPDRTFDEHVIIERNDGSLWVLVRTRYGIGQSFSHDGGRTWSDGSDSGQGGPNSRFALRRLRSGRLCLINHRTEHHLPGCADGQNREKLTVWLSDDDGVSWYGKLLLNPELNVSYPDFAEGEDGFIYAVYDHGRTEHGQIFLARFTERDIAAGEFIVSGSSGGILAVSFGR